MRDYLITLIEEKGKDIEDIIEIDGHIGLTYEVLIDFIDSMPEHWSTIRTTLTSIDFQNGDVFHYFNFLAKGMVKGL